MNDSDESHGFAISCRQLPSRLRVEYTGKEGYSGRAPIVIDFHYELSVHLTVEHARSLYDKLGLALMMADEKRVEQALAGTR